VVGGAHGVLEGGAGLIDLAGGVLEAALVVGEPGQREVAVLLGLGLGQREGLAGDEVIAGAVGVAAIERGLGEEQARLHLAPGIAAPRGRAAVTLRPCSGAGRTVGAGRAVEAGRTVEAEATGPHALAVEPAAREAVPDAFAQAGLSLRKKRVVQREAPHGPVPALLEAVAPAKAAGPPERWQPEDALPPGERLLRGP